MSGKKKDAKDAKKASKPVDDLDGQGLLDHLDAHDKGRSCRQCAAAMHLKQDLAKEAALDDTDEDVANSQQRFRRKSPPPDVIDGRPPAQNALVPYGEYEQLKHEHEQLLGKVGEIQAKAQFAMTQGEATRKLADEQLFSVSKARQERDESTSNFNTLRSQVLGLARTFGWPVATTDEKHALEWMLETFKPNLGRENKNVETARGLIRAADLAELEAALESGEHGVRGLVADWRGALNMEPPVARPAPKRAELEEARVAERKACHEIAVAAADKIASDPDLERARLDEPALKILEALESVREQISARNLAETPTRG